jgi:hypothetical protein
MTSHWGPYEPWRTWRGDPTPAELEQFSRDLEKALRRRPARSILPLRTRWALRYSSAVDGICIWLCLHGLDNWASVIWERAELIQHYHDRHGRLPAP